MKHLSRVVWSEGMYLGPHHFQVQGRYFEDSIQFATSSLWFESYGWIGCTMDAEALRNGTVSMVHGRGIFSDGLSFNMPECDALPAARQIADVFPPTRDAVMVSLAVPQRVQDGVNCVEAGSNGGAAPTRYIAETHVLHDETTGRDEKPVRLGRKNLSFVLDTEPAEGCLRLPAARVKRDGSGHFVYDPDFIPPCLRISASERLMTLLRRMVEILEEKSVALSRGKRTAGRSWAEYSTKDIASFWMLHTVNAALAPLQHIFLTKRGHPEELYVELARLAGGLCTFQIDSHPRALPLYEHERLDVCFAALDDHIRRHLETIVPTNCVSVPLTRVADYYYEGEITDSKYLTHSRWIFAIQAPIGEADLITFTPRLVKVCSQQYVKELVKRALPGLGLTHLSVPPSAISQRVDTQYFGLSKAGPCWESINKTRKVGVYVPGELPSPQPELLIVLES